MRKALFVLSLLILSAIIFTACTNNETNGEVSDDYLSETNYIAEATQPETAAEPATEPLTVPQTEPPIYVPAPVNWLNAPSLAEAFAPHFLFGNIYSTPQRMDEGNTRDAFLHHFNAVTAENSHKPDAFNNRGQTRPARYNFLHADPIVQWAVDNELTLIGHALVWHSQSPMWLKYDVPNDVPLTRAEARDNMEFHIRTMSEHWAAQGMLGAFYAWDVVNEAILSGGGVWSGDWRLQLRDSPWLRAYANGYDPEAGEHPSDYIYDAFVFARRYFPYSVLYYNDYNEEIPAKRNAIAQMVEQINERWAHDFENNYEAVPYGEVYAGRLLIEGIGLQSHFHLDQWRTNLANVRASLERFAETGVRLSVTELDITIGGQGGNHPATLSYPLSPEDAARQAEAFARVFGYYMEFVNYIERVSVWGKADHQSWRHWGHPLLFDRDMQTKPNFFAVLDAATSVSAPYVAVPVINEESLHSHWVGAAYSARITAHRNNWAPLRFHVTEGELPPGLILFAATGVINGTPTEAGSFTFTITASNAGGSYSREFSILIG